MEAWCLLTRVLTVPFQVRSTPKWPESLTYLTRFFEATPECDTGILAPSRTKLRAALLLVALCPFSAMV